MPGRDTKVDAAGDVAKRGGGGPSVSVIVALYNKAGHIARTLDSILAQTFRDFEVVVVDDGSTDDGPEIVRGYTDPRIRMIRQENSGPGSARNRGIAESSGGLVAFLDADDEWMPRFLERSVEWLEEYPDCDVSLAGYLMGPKRLNRFTGRFPEGPWRLPTGLTVRQLRRETFALWSGNMLYRRAVLERLGGFYDKERCTCGEDRYLLLKVQFCCRIYRSTEPLVWYHTEASGLWLGRNEPPPTTPMSKDPEPLRRDCPPEYRADLERLLADYAAKDALNRAVAGQSTEARKLLARWPLARANRRTNALIHLHIFLTSFGSLFPFFGLLLERVRRAKQWLKRRFSRKTGIPGT